MMIDVSGATIKEIVELENYWEKRGRKAILIGTTSLHITDNLPIKRK